MPDELFEVLMCTEVWHCTPSQFREQSAYDTELHWYTYQKILDARHKRNSK